MIIPAKSPTKSKMAVKRGLAFLAKLQKDEKQAFPIFDELDRVFGKDRAAGNEAVSTLDALEELEDEDKDVEAQQVHDLTTEDEITPNKQSCQRETPPSTAPSTNKTKKARTETIEILKDFSSKIEKISGVMEIASEHI
ncbi:hypothetical protein POM88_030786 [Heracleum sosnowskyi]|uniref:Uncharacterized protein n=1 Tax=Heracleum sosnowskyi TaxID=360622 RepID=A0AAD8HY86_9APIA|nr:hypothetical protein POM88_030786 [Heracleum sosnowskyi]